MDSPYFNKKDRLKKLGMWITQMLPAQTVNKEELHHILFGANAPYREQALHDAFSQLGKLLDRFLALQAFEADDAAQRLTLLKALAEQQQEAAFTRHWKKAHQALDAYPYRDVIFFEGQYALHQQASLFEATLQRRDQEVQLEQTVNYLDLSYWTARLKYCCELLNRAHILNQPAPLHLIEPVEHWIQALPSSYVEQPALRAYLLIFRTLESPEIEAQYLQMITWLNTNSQYFSPEEASDMYDYAQNCCIRRINQGDSTYLQHLFTLFEQLVAKGLILDKGIMDHRTLKNMVTVGIRLKAYDWVDTFLHSHRDKLLPRYQTDAYLFNLASLRYAQGEYSAALALLQQVEFQDVFYHLSAKSLMIKLYYESDADAALEFLLETFRLYLQRNQAISAFQRRVHLNLLRFTRKLYRLREQQEIISQKAFQERLGKLAHAIETTEEVANRSWLLERVGGLAFSE